MKLYELDRGAYFKLQSDPEAMTFKLDHIDGMYSVCWLNGEIIHIKAFAEVYPVPHLQELKCN